MSRFIVCKCCETRIPVKDSDVGRAVVCPTSRRLVFVKAEDVASVAPASTQGGRRWAAAALILLLAAGLTIFLWPTDRQRDVDAIASRENPAATPAWEPQPTNTSSQVIEKHSAASPLIIAPASNPKSSAVATRPETSTTIVPDPAKAPFAPPPVVASAEANPGAITQAADARGMSVHRLAKRIDLRTAEEIQKELLAVREIALDTPSHPATTTALIGLARARMDSGGIYPGPATAARNRPDLAGLPLQFGTDVMLFKDQAEALHSLSKRLRDAVQSCIPAGRADPRPDPEKLFTVLLSGEPGRFRNTKWATAESVPCVQQMLQPEGRDVRRMSVELLREIGTTAATEALVRWCVFDLEASNRAAAVDALRTRNPDSVKAQLLGLIRYPWPRAAEHAAEALVALELRNAVPDLAALLPLPDPDAPQAVAVSPNPGAVRRELVRVNHARNCVLCHPPSFKTEDLVRAAIPDPARPLAPPVTPGYYNSGSLFVSAAGTYLRQDFSAFQPVPNPGQWPDQQRYDYLVATRRTTDSETGSAGKSAYREAVLFALRELSGRDLGAAAADWVSVRGDRAAPPDTLTDNSWRMVVLGLNPDPLFVLYWSEFGRTLLDMDEAERRVVLHRFRRQFGAAGTAALMAYLGPLSRSADPAIRAKAETLLASFRPGESAAAADDRIDPEVAARLLGHKDAAVRAAAAESLRALGAKAKPYYKLLMKALKDPDAEVRVEAAGALGGIEAGPDEMFDALAAATRDQAGQVREAAADALTRLKTLPRSSAVLLAEGFLQPGTWATKEQQAAFENTSSRLLTGMNSRAAAAYTTLLRGAVGKVKTDVPPALLSRVLLPLAPSDAEDLKMLVGLLGRPGYHSLAEAHLLAAGDAAVRPLIDGLKAEDEKTRAATAELLGRAASLNRDPPATRENWRAAMDALAEVKSLDKSTDVKAAAVAALAKLTLRP